MLARSSARRAVNWTTDMEPSEVPPRARTCTAPLCASCNAIEKGAGRQLDHNRERNELFVGKNHQHRHNHHHHHHHHIIIIIIF
jgi:hypothetical protein